MHIDPSDMGYEHLNGVEIIAETTREPAQDLSDDEMDTVSELLGDSSCTSASIS